MVSRSPDPEGSGLLLSETGRICAYRTCWRDAEHLLCERHQRRLNDELTWLLRQLPDLTDYRINRAYGHRQGGGKTNGGSAPAPLREQLAVLLYQTDDQGYPGVEPLMYEWARSLALNVRIEEGPLKLTQRVRDCYRLMECPATPVYAEQLHSLIRKLTHFTNGEDDDMVIYGQCPGTDCLTQLAAPKDATEIQCPHCGSKWDVRFLQAERHKRIVESDWKATQPELRNALMGLGIAVKASTMRSWIHRGQLEQAGENTLSQPVYRLSDAYHLAVKDLDEQPETDVWKLITTKKGNNE